MAIVHIDSNLEKEIEKKFKKESIDVFSLFLSLEEYPKKGKVVGQIGAIVVKELKYKKFRFYFIADGYKIRFLEVSKLKDTIIKFVRMSEKKDQQKVIDEIKVVLRNLGDDAF